MEFRKDINALRCIAVLSVIIFHFNNDYLPGGFAGVDVFFVISGYLMTKIILNGIDKDTFNLMRFYLARAKRIIPALAITCIITMLIGWLFINPSDFYEMGKDVLSSILFISNFLYLSRSGYFDDSSVNNFLLHTWSLSVEWQFYIIYPVLLISIKKISSIKSAKRSITIMLAISFLASLYGTYNYAEASYYMFPTRAWAMLAGGLAFTLPSLKVMNKAFSIAGLSLIIISLIIINKDTPWPGVMATIPVLGSFLCIYSYHSLSLYRVNPIQYIGLISYEIYLVHWPILVLSRKLNLDINIAWYILLTFIISAILHKVVNLSTLNKALPAVFAACLASCILIILNNGYMSRVPEKFRLTKSEFHKKYYGGANYPSNRVYYLNSNEMNFKYIVSGDSFGMQYIKSLDDNKVAAATIFDHGCLIFPHYSRYLDNKEDLGCSEEYDKLKGVMDNSPTAPLIFASYWDVYDGKLIKKGASSPIGKDKDRYYSLVLSEILRVIQDGGSERKYYIVGRQQSTKADGFSCLAGESLLGYKMISNCEKFQNKEVVEINQYLQKNLENIDNVFFIDPNDALCDDNQCKVIYKNEPIYSDGTHLSIYGAELVTKYILKQL